MKKINLLKEEVEEIVRVAVAQAINTGESVQDSLKVEINPEIKLSEEEKIELVFSQEAEKKMHYLIQECDKEIAWHGVVERSENGFYVSDILVFPQKVSGTTVDSDEVEYPKWLLSQPDEVYNNLKFHGHSHVEMGVSPSSVDTNYQKAVLRQYMDLPQGERGFYIFGIFNKRGDFWLRIYDIDNNRQYSTNDITYLAYEPDEQTWAKKQIKEQVSTFDVGINSRVNYRSSAYWASRFSKEENEQKVDKNECNDSLTEKLKKSIIKDLTPPLNNGRKWSYYLNRIISSEEKLDDLIKEYCTTRQSLVMEFDD